MCMTYQGLKTMGDESMTLKILDLVMAVLMEQKIDLKTILTL